MEEEAEVLDASGWQTSDVKYYGDKTRSLIISGEIDTETSKGICSQILHLSRMNPIAPIQIFLNSRGGSIIDSLAIYDMIKASSCPVRIVVVGACYSAANIILAAGEVRLANPNSLFYFHPVSIDYNAVCSPAEMEALDKLYEWSHSKMELVVRKASKLDTNIWDTVFKDKTFYLTVEEAKQYNLIDDIIEYSS